MTEVRIGHAFVSGKPDHPDSTIASSSEWNADLLYRNGTNGEVPVRDTAQPTGARWTQGTKVASAQGITSGGTVTAPLASMPVTLTTSAFTLLTTQCIATTSAGQTILLQVRKNGTQIFVLPAAGDGIGSVVGFQVFLDVTGTYTYDIIASVATGTITNVNVSMFAVVIGV